MATKGIEANESVNEEAVEAVNRRLEARGWKVSHGTSRGKCGLSNGRVEQHEPIPDFQPIPSRGQPASEIIKEERG